MPHYLFDLYSAFTDSAFGGSHAGIIYDGEGLTTETMQQIAREVRAPRNLFRDERKRPGGGRAVFLDRAGISHVRARDAGVDDRSRLSRLPRYFSWFFG